MMLNGATGDFRICGNELDSQMLVADLGQGIDGGIQQFADGGGAALRLLTA